jgi:hypothetical protein
MSRSLYLLGITGLVFAAAAGASCSSPGGGSGASGDTQGAGAGSATSSASGNGVGGFNPTGGNGAGGAATSCSTDPNVDDDMDGFTEPEDCNDCDANVNPGSIEVVVTEPGMNGMVPAPSDEDCDGQVDNVLPLCDDNLALGDGDAMNGARAIDICQQASGNKWGVLSAEYVRANGSAAPKSAQFGLLDAFGPNVKVQLGSRMLGLSSGHARTPGQNGACNTFECEGYGVGQAPPGFPQNAPNCEQSNVIQDDVGLQIKLRAPKNATGYKYLFKFYSFEFAEYVCTAYNDQYIALVNPPPMGSQNGNISFDKNTNPVSVNIAFFEVCNPNASDFAAECNSGCPQKPNPYCPNGDAELVGTGFKDGWGEDAGATVWLQSQAPIGGGEEFTIRFAIWDTQDQVYDSTVLIDSFQWLATGGTVTVGTDEVPDPK